MPRRSGGGGGGGRRPMFGGGASSKPTLPATRPSSSVAASSKPTGVAQPAPGGGFLSNIASTAAGVAIGHTVGHAITGGLSGSGGHPATEGADMGNQQQQQMPACQFELQQFIDCSNNQRDLTLCTAFNDIYKQCKLQNGLQ